MLRRSPPDSDHGSVLMLMPACVLVVLVLASLAVDMALVHLRQRQAHDLAAAAANDAVTGGADPVVLRQGGYGLDPHLVDAVVDRSLAASDLAPHLVGSPEISIVGSSVEIALAVRADYLFAKAVPGAADGTVVRAIATATASPAEPSLPS
jgi:hypothetical protein